VKASPIVITTLGLCCCLLAGCLFEPYSDPIPLPASYAHYGIAEAPPTTQRIEFGSVTPAHATTTAPTVVAPAPPAIDDRMRDAILQATQAKIRQQYAIANKPQLDEYLILVGSLLTIKSPKPDVEYNFVLLDTPDVITAGIWPKTILISTGAIGQMEDESELAGAVAREISNLISGRTLTAVGISIADASTQSNVPASTQPQFTSAEQRIIREYTAKLTDQLIKDNLPPEATQTADREGAQFAAAALYAPDGYLRVLTRQKNATANWPRIQALDASVNLIAKANPAATNKLPARFEGYVRTAK
jgi:predicted Zn-dependent protease